MENQNEKMKNPISLCEIASLIKNESNLRFDQLPIEVYHFYIFCYLNIDDLLTLKLVSKKLFSIVRAYNVSEAWFQQIHAKCKWFRTNKSFNLRRLIENSKIFLLNTSTDLFMNLRFLKIDQLKSPLRLEHLCKFTKLQVLDFSLDFSDYSLRVPHFLHLPELKALSIYVTINDYNNLVLDCPKMHSLSVQINSNLVDMDKAPIKITHPSTVKFLEISTFEESLQMFNNLEYLGLNYIDDLSMNDLMSFKHLKKLIVYKASPINKLQELFRSKKLDLEFVYLGVKIGCIDKFKEFDEGAGEICFQIKNYNDLEYNLFPNIILSYDELISSLPNKQPPDFFRKYENILKINIYSKVKDQNLLINFIKKSRRLSILSLNKTSLNQDFYNKIPEISLLFWILIEEEDVELDFHFILKMEYLNALDTNQDVLVDRSLNFNELKYLNQINFNVEDNKFTISKETKRDIYHVKGPFWSAADKNRFNLNDIFDIFEEIRKS